MLWVMMAAILVGSQVAICLVAAFIHAHVVRYPPVWVVGLDILGSAIPAAIPSRAGRVTS
jgi:hypothetical protein